MHKPKLNYEQLLAKIPPTYLEEEPKKKPKISLKKLFVMPCASKKKINK